MKTIYAIITDETRPESKRIRSYDLHEKDTISVPGGYQKLRIKFVGITEELVSKVMDIYLVVSCHDSFFDGNKILGYSLFAKYYINSKPKKYIELPYGMYPKFIMEPQQAVNELLSVMFRDI